MTNQRHDPQPRDDDWSNALPYPEPDEDKHMKASDMLESKYLKQSDVENELTVTIIGLKKVNVARDDEEPDYRWTVRFKEFEKPMVYNATNIKRTAKALGDDTDGWIGKQMLLYVDPDIEFGGNIVGGLRVRALAKARPTRKPEDDAFLDEANRKFNDAADQDVPF